MSADFRAKLKALLGSLSESPQLKDEMAARRAYLGLTHEENPGFRHPQPAAHRSQLRLALPEIPATHYGMRAGMAAIRLRDLVENPDRWQFRTEEEREKFVEAVERRPLPTLPAAKFVAEMDRVVNQVYLN